MAHRASPTQSGEVAVKAAEKEGGVQGKSRKESSSRLLRSLSVSASVSGDTPVVVENKSDPEAGSASKSATTILVGFDGKNDPADPHNWSIGQKWAITTVVSLFTFTSPFTSTYMSPSSGQIKADFDIHNQVTVALCTSIFLLAYALGPLFIGPLSEIFGRVRVLQIANAWLILFNLVTAWAPNKEAFIIFRFLAGLGGSAPLSIGGGVIGDVWRPEERGQAVAIYSLCPLLAPCLGPLLGSFVAQYSRWQWIFWSSSIFMTIVQLLGLWGLKETYAPIILQRKAAIIRKANPDKDVRTIFETGDRHWHAVIRKGLFRPLYLFAHEPIIQVFAIIQAVIYGQIYLILVTISTTFTNVYGWRLAKAGLGYIALGLGITSVSQIGGHLMDRIYRYYSNKNGGVGKPEFRLVMLYPTGVVLAAGYLIYGWTADQHVFWLAPCIGLVLIGGGMIGFFAPSQIYIIDCFDLHAASALAAVTCLRSIFGFAFPLFAHQLFDTLGLGGGSSLLAGLSFVIGVPAPLLMWRYGERLRLASRHAGKHAK